MKFYVASGYGNKNLVKKTINALHQKSWTNTYDWTQSSRQISESVLALIGEDELNGVKNADVVIILLPGGKGTHVELGIALGLSKRVYLYSPDDSIKDYEKTCTFYYVNKIHRFIGAFDEFITYFYQIEGIPNE
jgi:nucleoside 2-deoxyribosyltransferase